MRREADPEGDSNPYSQHSKLLEPSEVILMDPCDVVTIELPGRERGEGSGEQSGLGPQGSAQTPLHLAQLKHPLTHPAKKPSRPEPLCSSHSCSRNHEHGTRLGVAETRKRDSTLGTHLDGEVGPRAEDLEIVHSGGWGHSGSS